MFAHVIGSRFIVAQSIGTWFNFTEGLQTVTNFLFKEKMATTSGSNYILI